MIVNKKIFLKLFLFNHILLQKLNITNFNEINKTQLYNNQKLNVTSKTLLFFEILN